MVDSEDEKEYGGSRSKNHSNSRKRSRHDHERDDTQHRQLKGSKHNKRDKKNKHRKSRYDDDDTDEKSGASSSASLQESSSENRRDRKKRHKRDRHDKERKDKKRSKKDRHKKYDNHEHTPFEEPLERNHLLANELCSLFDHHPNFASELPIMLIRLGRGATFDLSGMTDQDAAQRLIQVFQCLAPFGVTIDDDNVWSWKNPAVSQNSTPNNELVLIRVVRALLDQIGLTIDAIEDFENPPLALNRNQSTVQSSSHKAVLEPSEFVDSEVEYMTKKMLETFRDSNLADELAGICNMIQEGEMINLDGVPDDTVRQSLESLLSLCGLEKSEMDVDDDDEDDDIDAAEKKNIPPMGYGLPETDTERVKCMLSNVINTCQSKPKADMRRPVKGPMLPGAFDDLNNSSDDEGPLPAGAAAIVRDNKLSKEQIKSLAARRAYELSCAKEGIDIDPESMNGVREEWMVVPGKYDFLGSIQTGRSRTFASKSKLNNNTVANDELIDPKIQAEIRAIREAYEETRGPSLMEQHRETKRLEQQQLQQNPTAASWKWNRDKDLDDGRRVDTEALGMILGGAGTDLKNKFQSGM